MSTNASMTTPREMREKLIGKATEDAEFRVRLTADPRAAVQEALGVEIPEAFSVHVHEETARKAHIVLPPAADLSEQELGQVSGAFDWSWPGSGF